MQSKLKPAVFLDTYWVVLASCIGTLVGALLVLSLYAGTYLVGADMGDTSLVESALGDFTATTIAWGTLPWTLFFEPAEALLPLFIILNGALAGALAGTVLSRLNGLHRAPVSHSMN